MQRDERVKLGVIARDRISGFQGVVVAVCDWLNGCRRVTIDSQELKDGKPVGASTFDSEQLEWVAEFDQPVAATKTGGPPIAPTRNADPS